MITVNLAVSHLELPSRLPPSRVKARATYMLKTYGITPEQRDAMVQRQDGKCLGCELPFGGKVKPVIDHCHESAAVRGILCNKCNAVLGFCGDNAAVLRRLARYLDPFEGLPAGLKNRGAE